MAASTTDFVHGIDPTGFTSITGAQLAQLVDSASPYTDKGLIVTTTDSSGVPLPPDAETTTKWQNYLWLRQIPLTTSFSVYAWNPNQEYNINYSGSTAGYVTSKWNPIASGSIPANSIEGFQIKPDTISGDRIQTITINQVTGFVPANYVLSAAAPNVAGIISGSYNTGLTINNDAVTNTMLKADATSGAANAAVKTTNIVDKNVTAAKVLGGSNGQFLKTTDASTNAGWVTPNDIVAQADAAVAVSGNGSKVLAVNSGATAYELVSSRTNSFGKVLAYSYSAFTSSPASASTIAGTATTLYGATGNTVGFNSGAITPIAGVSGSKHTIRVVASLQLNANPCVGWVWLYNANTAGVSVPLAAARWDNTGGNVGSSVLSLTWQATLSSNSPVTYYVTFGGSNGTVGNIKLNPGSETSSIEVIEII